MFTEREVEAKSFLGSVSVKGAGWWVCNSFSRV